MKRFPVYHLSLKVGRKVVATSRVVARPIGAEVETDWPIFEINRQSLADVLLLIMAQAYKDQDLGRVANSMLEKRGYGPPLPLVEITANDRAAAASDDDIPF